MTDLSWTEVDKRAVASADLHPLISERWSPRALDPAAEIEEPQLRALLEAARWAPSCANLQPSRFLVGRRGDSTFQRIFDTLRPGNQTWAGEASVLLVGVVMTVDDTGRPMPAAEYGLGLAVQNLVVQALADGWVAHQMAGFDPDAVRAAFGLPEQAQPLVAVAIGALGSLDQLSEQLREREIAPRERKPLAEIAFAGSWGTPAL
ncbi:nitroreductase family protein [Kutzneria viridogrisea]|uniref:Nitroreductase family protein n=2 Tax=Kutzneria TaxID=43356 RepID=W5W658_9PSEU|nr:nitroreductase family protein [Kutzneria albida]AHH93644.1 nitroreductase family protein [Kutzneria albida DSM 43870]MBA8928972.1 nitroreductase [Kutzneria viridogrisea]